eukprot:gene26889-32496_t
MASISKTFVIRLLAFAAVLFATWAADTAISLEKLRSVKENINSNVAAFCYHGPSGTKNAYLAGTYDKYTDHVNVLVYPFCLETRELGNRLGNYFHEVTCAEAAGLHFVAIHPQWDVTNSINGNQSKEIKNRLAFLQALPDAIVHASPLDRFHSSDRLQKYCKCSRYCWQHSDAPWVNRTNTIASILRGSVNAYLASLGEQARTEIDPEHDLTNAPPGSDLPIIPDVALQYRCGDNLGFSYRYGILPFTAFDSRIPSNSKHIYVLSDHPSRSLHNPNTARCKLILEKLFEYLKRKFPSAVVVVKRGGDLFLDYARLTLAKVAICSASSYCFWPAVSNPHTAYFPLTPLIAGADNMQLAVPFGPHFHWMNESYVSSFKGLRPWTQIVDVLEGRMAVP